MDSWNDLMYSVYRSVQSSVPLFLTQFVFIFFVICVTMGNLVLLNLFLAILINNFTANRQKEKNLSENILSYSMAEFVKKISRCIEARKKRKKIEPLKRDNQNSSIDEKDGVQRLAVEGKKQSQEAKNSGNKDNINIQDLKMPEGFQLTGAKRPHLNSSSSNGLVSQVSQSESSRSFKEEKEDKLGSSLSQIDSSACPLNDETAKEIDPKEAEEHKKEEDELNKAVDAKQDEEDEIPPEFQEVPPDTFDDHLFPVHIRGFLSKHKDPKAINAVKAQLHQSSQNLKETKTDLLSQSNPDLAQKNPNIQGGYFEEEKKAVAEGKTLWIFGPKNRFRLFLFNLFEKRSYIMTSHFLGILTSLFLVLYNPLKPPHQGLNNVVYYVENVTFFYLDPVLRFLGGNIAPFCCLRSVDEWFQQLFIEESELYRVLLHGSNSILRETQSVVLECNQSSEDLLSGASFLPPGLHQHNHPLSDEKFPSHPQFAPHRTCARLFDCCGLRQFLPRRLL